MDKITIDFSSDEDDPYTNSAGRLNGNIFSLFTNRHILDYERQLCEIY